MAVPPNTNLPNAGTEKQGPKVVKVAPDGTFAYAQVDSFGQPWPTSDRGEGLQRALTGYQLKNCNRCGCPLSSYQGMDNHNCASPWEYYSDVSLTVTDDKEMKRN